MPVFFCLPFCGLYLGYELPITAPSLLDVTLSSQDNSNISRICTSNSICDGYNEACDFLDPAYNGSALCCTSSGGCDDANNITISGVVQSDYNVGLRCDGRGSCKVNRIIINGKNGGDLYFSGKDAGEVTNIIATNNSNIICSGHQSCLQSKFSDALNVLCLGEQGCYASEISNVDNAFGYAHDSIANSMITDISDSVYCAAQESCTSSQISDVGNNLYGTGYRTLRGSQITNVTNVCNLV